MGLLSSITRAKRKILSVAKAKRIYVLGFTILLTIIAGVSFWIYTQNKNPENKSAEHEDQTIITNQNPLENTEPLELKLENNSQLYRVSYTSNPEGKTHAIVEYFDDETNSFIVYNDSETLRDFKVSDDGRYIAKIDSGAVYVAEAAETLDFKEVIPSQGPSINDQIVWLSDSSGFLIRSTETKGGQPEGYVSEYTFTISRYSISEQAIVSLFTHTELMGGLHIIDADSERNELYWYTTATGGWKSFGANRISDGEKLVFDTALDDADTDAYDMFVRDGRMYYRANMKDYFNRYRSYIRVYDMDENRSWPIFGHSNHNEVEDSLAYSRPYIQWLAAGLNNASLVMLNVEDGDSRITGVYEMQMEEQHPFDLKKSDTLLRGKGFYHDSHHEGTYEGIGTFVGTYCTECEEKRRLHLLRDKKLQEVPAARYSGTIYLASLK